MRKFKALLLLLIICMLMLPSAAQTTQPVSYAPIETDAEQHYAMNLFLSNFTETGIRAIEQNSPDEVLIEFAHAHRWFNDRKAFEFGEYFNGNNCRISDEKTQTIINNYFYDPYPWGVDLSDSHLDHKDGYYYHCETGGWTSCGFAETVCVCPAGENIYFVSFMIFGGAYSWTNSELWQTPDEAAQKYGYPDGYGSALIYAEDIADRSTYKMISYSRL